MLQRVAIWVLKAHEGCRLGLGFRGLGLLSGRLTAQANTIIIDFADHLGSETPKKKKRKKGSGLSLHVAELRLRVSKIASIVNPTAEALNTNPEPKKV